MRARAAASGPPEEPLATRRTSGPERPGARRAQRRDRGAEPAGDPGRARGDGEGGRQRPEPSEPDPHRPQRGGQPREHELLARRHGHGRSLPAAGVEPEDLVPRPLLDQPAVAQRVAAFAHHAQGGGARAAAGRAGARCPGHEVADVDAHRQPAAGRGPAQREGTRQVAGDVVVPEGRQERRPGRRRARPGLLDHRPDERALAGRVDVVGAGVDGGVQRRPAPAGERADGGEKHVATPDEGGHGRRVGDVGDRGAPGGRRRSLCPARGQGRRRGRRPGPPAPAWPRRRPGRGQ